MQVKNYYDVAISCKKFLFLCFLLILSQRMYSQAVDVQVTLLGTPVNVIEACSPARQLQVKIINYGPDSTLSNVQLQTQFSSCVQFFGNSANVTADTTASPILSFSANTVLNVGDSLIFTLDIGADCSIVGNAQNCNGIQTFNVSAIIGANIPFSQSKTIAYNLVYPALAISSVSPSPLIFDDNGNACRTITIKNGGFGAAYGFTLTDKHGKGLSVTDITHNATSICTNCPANVSTDAIAEYTGILLPDDSIQLVECIHKDSCNAHYLSNLVLNWGCSLNGNTCKQTDDSIFHQANIANVYGNLNGQWLQMQQNNCLEDPQVQEMMWLNQGNSTIHNLSIFASGYWASGITGFIPDSIQIKHHINDTYVPFTNYIPYLTTAVCPESDMYALTLNLGDLASGDTIFVKWAKHNCQDTCDGSDLGMMSFYIWVNYENDCEIGTGYWWDYAYPLYGNFSPLNLSLASVDTNVVFQANVLMTTTGANNFQYNYANTGTFMIDINTSANLSYGGTILDTSLVSWIIDTTTFHPNSISLSNNGHNIHLAFLHPYNNYSSLYYALYNNGITELLFPLIAHCNTADSDSFHLSFYYRPDTACSYTIPYLCINYPIQVLGCGNDTTACPSSNFISTKKAETYRQTVGTADANNDGAIDTLSTPLNENLIKRDRYIYKDTLVSKMMGIIEGTDSFEYVYAIQEVNYGKFWDNVANFIHVYDKSVDTYYTFTYNIATLKDISATLTNYNATFTYNLYDFVNAVGSPFPSGFHFDAGDSIWLTVSYKNNYGIWHNIHPANALSSCDNYLYSADANVPYQDYYQTIINSHFEGSHIANTDSAYLPILCGEKINNSLLGLGIYVVHHPWSGSIGVPNSCQVVAQFAYSVSLGGLAYYNANWFPYEHRPVISLPNEININIPTGYAYSYASYHLWNSYLYPAPGRANGSLCTPTISGAQLNFDIRNCYEDKGGTILLSDETVYMEYNLFFNKIGCNNSATPSTWNVDYDYVETNDSTTTICRTNTVTIPAIQSAAFVNITSPQQAKCGYQDTMVYDINISEHNGWIANNAFLYIKNNGLNVIKVVETTNGTNIILNNAFPKMYHLGNIPYYYSHARTFKIYVKSKCNNDSLNLIVGWSCSPAPSTQAQYNAFTCDRTYFTLHYCKADAQLQILDGSPSANIDLCDTDEFIVKVRSAYEGYPHDIKIQAILPANLLYVSGSSKMYYVDSTHNMVWTPIANPVSPDITWNLNSIFNQTHFELPGVSSLDSNEIWIKFKAIPRCGFTSGSNITFKAIGKNPCGNNMSLVQTITQPIKINGIIDGNLLFPTISVIPPANICGIDILTFHAKVYNFTDTTTSSENYYEVSMPNDYFQSFVMGSVSGNTLPIIMNPSITLNTPLITLRWKLPILQKDSFADFTFKMLVSDSVSCEGKAINCRATTADSMYCPITNDTCLVFATTGSSGTTFGNALPFYSLSYSGYANDTLANKIALVVHLQNDSDNATQTNLPVEIYCDSNNDGQLSVADVLLDTYIIPNGINAHSSYKIDTMVPRNCAADSLILHLSCTCYDVNSNLSLNTFLVPLPIYELVLAGNATDKGNILTFEAKNTPSEATFSLQKRTETGNYTEIYPSPSTNFMCIDKNCFSDEVYKVIMTYGNGTQQSSNIVSLYNPFSFVEIYPNPTDNVLTIKYTGGYTNGQMLHARIYDEIGKKVREISFEGNGQAFDWDVSTLASGTYYFELSDELGKKYKQLFVRK